MAQILDGLKVSKEIKEEVKEEVKNIVAGGKRPPHLAAILVGENGASIAYVNNKIKDCEEVGFVSSLVKLPDTVSEEELLTKIEALNNDPEVDGFIVQLPLPKHIDQEKIIMAIDPSKDVDGFHPENFGKMALEMDAFLPATPFVVLAHSYTQNIEELTKEADIVITALGSPLFLKAEMIKDGAVVIDVGITRVEDSNEKKGYKLVGDVDFNDCEKKAGHITPVPGGVGPMTRAMLMKNTILAYKNKN